MRKRTTKEVIQSLNEFKKMGLETVGLGYLSERNKEELEKLGYKVEKGWGVITIVSWQNIAS